VRDVATCPNLSRRSREADRQSKSLLANIEPRTDSAPSMLGVPQSTASTSGMHQVLASQSVSVVDVTSVMQPRVSHVTEAVTQFPQPIAGVSAAASIQHSSTRTADAVTDVAASSSLKQFHDKAVEGAESNFVYHDETACDHMLVDTTSSLAAASNQCGTVSKVNAGNTVLTEQGRCTSLSDEAVMDSTETSLTAALRSAAEMPYMDESVDVPDTSVAAPCNQPDSASESMIVTVDEESNMSVTKCDEMCHLSTTLDDVDETAMCCSSEAADYASNDESHSTMEDTQLVSRLFCVYPLFLSRLCISKFLIQKSLLQLASNMEVIMEHTQIRNCIFLTFCLNCQFICSCMHVCITCVQLMLSVFCV